VQRGRWLCADSRSFAARSAGHLGGEIGLIVAPPLPKPDEMAKSRV